ncbi:MAG: GDSL-type esterase/lipase family protein [Planctomycetota bacterium]
MIQQTPQKNSSGAKALFVCLLFIFVIAVLYELAIFSYSPKDRPLVFKKGVVISYSNLLLVWSVITAAVFGALLFHRRLYRFLWRISILRRFWRGIIVCFISITIGLLIFEAGLRVIDPMGISAFPRVLHFWDKMMIPDAHLRYRLRTSTKERFSGVEVAINSDGMRDDGPMVPKTGRRILVLGDSVSFGASVPIEATAFRCLEDLFEGRERVDVVNAAVPSYNTVVQRRLLEMIGDKYNPDLVLLVYVENDIWTDDTLPYYPAQYWHQAVFLPRSLAMYSYIRHPLRLALQGLTAKKVHPKLSSEEEVGWQRSREALAGIHQWCRDRGIPFMVVFYQMLDPQAGELYFTLLSTAGHEIGFQVVDSRPFFEERSSSEIHMAPVDTHLNEFGHKLMAEGVYDKLLEFYPGLFNVNDSNAVLKTEFE